MAGRYQKLRVMELLVVPRKHIESHHCQALELELLASRIIRGDISCHSSQISGYSVMAIQEV